MKKLSRPNNKIYVDDLNTSSGIIIIFKNNTIYKLTRVSTVWAFTSINSCSNYECYNTTSFNTTIKRAIADFNKVYIFYKAYDLANFMLNKKPKLNEVTLCKPDATSLTELNGSEIIAYKTKTTVEPDICKLVRLTDNKWGFVPMKRCDSGPRYIGESFYESIEKAIKNRDVYIFTDMYDFARSISQNKIV